MTFPTGWDQRTEEDFTATARQTLTAVVAAVALDVKFDRIQAAERPSPGLVAGKPAGRLIDGVVDQTD